MARILVVDDDEDLRETVAFALRRGQYQVVEAADGREALKQMRQALPDLVLLDLMMPRLDGRGFLAARQADPSLASVPVVIMSAWHREAQTLREQGHVQAVLRKPFSTAELLRTVNRLLAED